jgi:hypothetical protein
VSAIGPTQVLPTPAQPMPKPVVAKATTPRPAPAAKPKSGSRAMLCAAAGVAVVALIAGAVWWFAGRASSRNAAEFEGYRSLFNGKDLTGWRVRDKSKVNAWTVQDGALVNTEPKTYLVSEETFGDFEFHCEYRLNEKSDGGVYLRGLYQIQFVPDVGKPPSAASSGAIHELIAPSENAAKGADEWQTLDAKLVGRKVTVTLNGRQVIEGGELARATKLSLNIALDAPGPIMLQGHLGTCEYRNIRIKPLSGPAGQVDAAFVREVAALPAEQQVKRVVAMLKKLNPDFDPSQTTIDSKVKDGQVSMFKLTNAGKLTDLSPVRALAGLKCLELGEAKAADLTPLNGLRLERLLFHHMDEMSDLSPLQGMPLKFLLLEARRLSDLNPLKGVPLETLHVHSSQASDVSPLSGMTTLKSLRLQNVPVSNLSPLKGLGLGSLHLGHTKVSDLSPLRDMPLKNLECEPDLLTREPNRTLVRSIATLQTINRMPAADFWKQVDAGKLPDAVLASAAAQPPRQTIDLLALTDPVKDRVQAVGGAVPSKANVWERRDGALVYVSDSSSGKLVPPVAINARSYEIEIHYERMSGPGSFHVDLPFEGSQLVPVYLDARGFRTITSGIGRPWPSSIAKPGCAVIRMDRGAGGSDDRITVHVNGELWEDWKGNLRTLNLPKGEPHPDFPGQPMMLSLFVRTDWYRFTAWTLRVFDGEATVLRRAAAAQPPRQTVDLLALTDPVTDRIMPRNLGKANTWERRGRSLAYVSDGKAGKVAAPVAIRARSYEIEVEFERLSGRGHFHVDLPLEDGRIIPIFLDCPDGKLIAQREGGGWPTGRAGRGRVVVRLDRGVNGALDRFSARLDDETLSNWQGNITRFAMSPEPYPLFPGQPLTSIFCFSDSYEIRSWQLRIFDGEATVLRGGDSAAPADAAWQNAINLLPLIDPQKDAVAGEWTLVNGELVGEKDIRGRIEIPYQPPEEYDFLVEFSGKSGGIGAMQMLAKGQRGFRWACFADSGGVRTVFGFDMIGGKVIHQSPTRTELMLMKQGRRYVSKVEVRNNGVRAFLDGKLVATWQTDYADMDLPRNWELRGSGLLGIGAQADRIMFHRIEVREVTGKGTFTRGAAATSPVAERASVQPDAADRTLARSATDAGWQDAINLLPLIDLSQDVNSGKWEAGPGGLVATDIKDMSQKIQPPYRPPEEYDYRVSFTPISGNADVAIGLTAKGRSFVFYMKKYANDHCLGFEAIGGKAIAHGPTAHRFPHLEMARQYTVVVEVRKNGLRGYLDGKLVAQWATDYSDMSAWPVWKFKDDTLPGFGCSLSTVVFQEVKLREISGKGVLLRPPPK